MKENKITVSETELKHAIVLKTLSSVLNCLLRATVGIIPCFFNAVTTAFL